MAGLTGHLEGSVVPSPRLQKRSSTSLYATYPTLRREVCCNSAYRMRFLQPSLRRLVQVSLSFRAVCLCHPEQSVPVIPSGLSLSFRAVCSCHSERSVSVIPSAAKESLSCHFNQAEPLCHFDRAQRVEKSTITVWRTFGLLRPETRQTRVNKVASAAFFRAGKRFRARPFREIPGQARNDGGEQARNDKGEARNSRECLVFCRIIRNFASAGDVLPKKMD